MKSEDGILVKHFLREYGKALNKKSQGRSPLVAYSEAYDKARMIIHWPVMCSLAALLAFLIFRTPLSNYFSQAKPLIAVTFIGAGVIIGEVISNKIFQPHRHEIDKALSLDTARGRLINQIQWYSVLLISALLPGAASIFSRA